MSKVTEPLEYSKDWTDSIDFPTTEYSESRVRADIQLLFDEIKAYINNTVVTALNDNMDRIASLGGGGEVTHELMGPDSVGADNLIDGSVTEFKYGDDSIPATAYQDGSISSDKFDTDSVSDYVKDVSYEKTLDSLTNDAETVGAVKSIVEDNSSKLKLVYLDSVALFPEDDSVSTSTRRIRASAMGLDSFEGLDFIVQAWAEPSWQFTDHVVFQGVADNYSWCYTVDRDANELHVFQSYDGRSFEHVYWIHGHIAVYVVENSRGDYTHDDT